MKTNGLTRLKVASSKEYSTKRAIQLLYKLHSEADEIMTGADEAEMLSDEEVDNKYFFVEAVDWGIVRPTVIMMLNQLTDRIKI